MIDTHIHLLPSVDDGASDIVVTRQMAAQAIEEGVSEMILTPHFVNRLAYQEHAREQFQMLNWFLKAQNLKLKIHLGNEIRLAEENMEAIFSGLANTMGDSDYLLMELSSFHFYEFHEALLDTLLEKDYKIILAHIERYRIFQEQPQKLGELIERGMFAQMTSSYLTERSTRKKALAWLDTGWIHLIASDGHNLTSRPPVMRGAYEMVRKRYSEETARLLFENNPRAVIENRELEAIAPQKRFKIF